MLPSQYSFEVLLSFLYLNLFEAGLQYLQMATNKNQRK